MTVIDDVKSRLDIVEVIGAQVALKRAGRNFSGLCPFHSERTAPRLSAEMKLKGHPVAQAVTMMVFLPFSFG